MPNELADPLLEDAEDQDQPLLLVVDDEASNLAFYRACLEEEGYRVACAGNGREAVEKARECKPDLVLLDVRMPVMNGYTACRALRERDATKFTPILFLTALGDEDNVQTGIQSGADDFLAKPVHAEELKVRVRSLLRIRRYRDELERAVSYIRILQEESDKLKSEAL